MKITKEPRNFFVASFWGAITIAITGWLWPKTIPFRAFDLWTQHGSLVDGLFSARFFLAWGAGFTLFVEVLEMLRALKSSSGFTRRVAFYEPSAGTILGHGLVTSLFAGIFEEIGFRWLIFLSSIAWTKVTNWIFFGFLGFGIPEWLFVHVFGPLANWTTLGYLQPQLLGGDWAIGAAMLASNAFFRDGHRYQGWFGTINAWFAGMFLFWMTFHHGLFAAIVVHFAYDAIIDVLRALGRKLRGRS